MKFKMNPSPPDVCITCDATDTNGSNLRVIVCKATQEIATSRTVARSATVGRVDTHRRMSTTSLRNFPATNAAACFADTSPHRCSSCALDR